jgi:EpsI family protein
MTMAWRSVLLVALLLAASAGRMRLGAQRATVGPESLSRFPAAIGAWSGQDSPFDQDVIQTAAVDDYLNRYYRSGDGVLGLYVGYYRSQGEGGALHSPMQCLPGAGWEPMRTESIPVTLADGTTRIIDKLLVQKGIDRMLVLYWYQTVSRVTSSEYLRKFFVAADAFRSGRTDVALVRIIAPIDPRDGDGEAKALWLSRPFAERVLPEVQKELFQR